jgi:DNA repair protein RadC
MHLGCLTREHFMVAYLRNDLSLITADLMFTGDTTGVLVENMEIVRRALILNATHIIVAHNHPSGKSLPSEDDIRLTHELINLLKQFNIPLIDHIIIGAEPYSMYQNDII